jgi:hypothetical protein
MTKIQKFSGGGFLVLQEGTGRCEERSEKRKSKKGRKWEERWLEGGCTLKGEV